MSVHFTNIDNEYHGINILQLISNDISSLFVSYPLLVLYDSTVYEHNINIPQIHQFY